MHFAPPSAPKCDLAYLADSPNQWLVLLASAYSTEQAAGMRAGGRRLFRDIDREGAPL